MNSFDLHMHSCYSKDGEYTPETLIQMVHEAGLTTIALSDHDSPHGIDEMISYAKPYDIQVIPAIEFSTLFQGNEVHLLGYNMDYTKPYFQTIAQENAKLTNAAIRQRIVRICEYYDLDYDIDKLIAKGDPHNSFPGIIAHIMNDPRYMQKPEFLPYQPGGLRAEPQCVNFYWDNCSSGNPCYIHVELPDMEMTAELIHEAGGIAIIAHPWRNFYQREDRLQAATKAGIDGLEAYSNYHETYHNEYYDAYCKEHELIMTCGSDFHGHMKPNISLGEYGYQKDDGESVLQLFLQALHK